MKQSQAGNNNVMDQSQESAWGGHSWHSQFEGRNAQPASGRNTAMDRSMVEMSRIDGLIKKQDPPGRIKELPLIPMNIVEEYEWHTFLRDKHSSIMNTF